MIYEKRWSFPTVMVGLVIKKERSKILLDAVSDMNISVIVSMSIKKLKNDYTLIKRCNIP
ncbi:hypothetical protein CVR97_28290 [Salmonella enterica subsp. enterica serovar Typhimurium]|nr:hypothetical protein CVR97_28290 [Salmonella enterica subsp. enterica serovar Typhimurium]